MRKWFIGMLIGILTIGILTACGSESSNQKGNQLVMGTSADFPPFEYIDTAKSDKIIGFDVDLANALGKKLNYKIKVKDIDFTGLIPALQSNKVDFVMAGMEGTPKRKKNADFTDPYFVSDLSMIVAKDSGIKKYDDVKGNILGVQQSSIEEDKAKELQKTTNFKMVTRDRIPDLVQELYSGRISGVLMEDAVSKGYLEKNNKLDTVSVPNSKTGGASIAFPKDSKLTDKFNKALQEMKDNGEMDKLIKKWFD